MKTNTVQQIATSQDATQIFQACLSASMDDFTLDQPYSFDCSGCPSLDVDANELAVSYHADFIGTIFQQDGLWHITSGLEGFANELDASRHLLALEALDGHVIL